MKPPARRDLAQQNPGRADRQPAGADLGDTDGSGRDTATHPGTLMLGVGLQTRPHRQRGELRLRSEAMGPGPPKGPPERAKAGLWFGIVGVRWVPFRRLNAADGKVFLTKESPPRRTRRAKGDGYPDQGTVRADNAAPRRRFQKNPAGHGGVEVGLDANRRPEPRPATSPCVERPGGRRLSRPAFSLCQAHLCGCCAVVFVGCVPRPV